MTSSNNILFLLIGTVFAIASCQEQQQLQQITTTNYTVVNDPCLGQEQDVLFPNLLSIGVHFYKSSFIESCYESLSINTTNTLQHIEALNQIFRDS